MAKSKTTAAQPPAPAAKAVAKTPPPPPAKAQLTLPLKTAAPKRKKKKINQAAETKQFLTVLAMCTLALVFLMYIILMKSSR